MNLYAQLKNIYTKQTYTQKYGGYMWLSLLIITVFITIIGYFMSGGKTNSLKKNWAENRCNPGVMPFAGIINNTTGKSAMEYTEDNFNYCVENIIGSIANAFIAPLLFALSALNKIFSDMPGIFSELLKLLKDLMDFLKSLMAMFMVIIENIIVAIEKLVGDIRDIINKLFAVKGVVGGIIQSVIVAGAGFANWIFAILVEFILLVILTPLLFCFQMSLGAAAVIPLAAVEGENIHDITGFSRAETIGITETIGATMIASDALLEGALAAGIGNILAGIIELEIGVGLEAGFFTFFVGLVMAIIGSVQIMSGLGFLVVALVLLSIFTVLVILLEWIERNLVTPMNTGASAIL